MVVLVVPVTAGAFLTWLPSLAGTTVLVLVLAVLAVYATRSFRRVLGALKGCGTSPKVPATAGEGPDLREVSVSAGHEPEGE